MAGAMFFISREKKIAFIFVVNMLFSLLEFDFIPGLQNAISLVIVVFILSEIKNIHIYVNKIKNNIKLKRIFLLLVLMTSLDIIFSPHLHNSVFDSIKYIYNYLLLKYSLVFCCLVAFVNQKSLLTLVRYSMAPMLILTLFGIINFIQGRSAFVTEMMSNHISTNFVTTDAGDHFVNSSRFRIQSMFQNPFNYGYICSVCLLLYIYARKHMNKLLFGLMLICCLFGIIMCNCRTVILCAFLGIGIFFLIAFNSKRITQLGIIITVIFVLLYGFVPVVADKIDYVFSVFDSKDNDQRGSSLTMRSVQIATTLKYIEDKPWFGNGVYFFNIDLGWDSSDKSMTLEKDLYGLEGVYLAYLLEHGWVGYILYLMVWITMLIYLIKNLHFNRELVALGIAIWSIYFLFAHLTGELDSVRPTLIVLGGCYGIISLKHKDIQMNNKKNMYL